MSAENAFKALKVFFTDRIIGFREVSTGFRRLNLTFLHTLCLCIYFR